jgi:hypothetical protein
MIKQALVAMYDMVRDMKMILSIFDKVGNDKEIVSFKTI